MKYNSAKRNDWTFPESGVTLRQSEDNPATAMKMKDTPEAKGDLLSFKEMCEKFDVTPRTLRYYEYIELLEPEKEGRTRWYSPREVARMTLIIRGRRWGFSLEECRQFLLIYDEEGTEAQNKVWVEMADRQFGVLDEQIRELRTAREELQDMRDQVARAMK